MAANLVEYLASPLTEADLKRFDRKLGDPRGTPPVGTQAAEQAGAPYGERRFHRDAHYGPAHEGAWIRLNPHLNPTAEFISQALLMILPMLSADRRHPRRPYGVRHHRCGTQR